MYFLRLGKGKRVGIHIIERGNYVVRGLNVLLQSASRNFRRSILRCSNGEWR